MATHSLMTMRETEAADAVAGLDLRAGEHSVREFMVPSIDGTLLAGDPMPALVRKLWNVKIKQGDAGLFLDRYHGIVQDHFVEGVRMFFSGAGKLWLTVTTTYAVASDPSDGQDYRTGGKVLSVNTAFVFSSSGSGPEQTDTQQVKTDAFIICEIREAETDEEKKIAVGGFIVIPVLDSAIFYSAIGFR